MKQLYLTNNGVRNGVQVRAVSVGVAERQVAAASRHASYAAPVVNAENVATFTPPIRLAWLDTPEAGRLLCHSTCLGIDPGTGRNGHFFSHLLLDVPGTLDAQHAIQTWGSQLWQRTDPGGTAALPEALSLPVSSALGDQRLKDFLQRPADRELFEFILAALLGGQRRIFVAAPAEAVALCVYGVTRALPPEVLADFSFSTYEHDPLNSPARLVGTCWTDEGPRDLPATCYDGTGVGFNTYTGRRSAQVVAAPFAQFAVEALASGETAALDEFHTTWQRLGVQDGGLLDLVYRLVRGTAPLSKEESHTVLHHPTLGAWLADRADVLEQVVEWALDDHTYATATFSRMAALLRQRPDTLARLAHLVEERGLAALRDGDLARTQNALEVILPMTAPARAAAVWGDLLNSYTNPESLDYSLRYYLLPRLARLHAPAADSADPALERWLHVAPDRLESLIALDLPPGYHVAACLASLRHDGATPALARVLAGQPRLLLPVLRRVGPQAGILFDALVAESPRYEWVSEVVRHGHDLPAALVSRCIETTLDKDVVDAPALVREHGPALLELLAEQPGLERLARRLLQQSADELLADTAIGTFLQGLAGLARLDSDVRERLAACLTVQTFLRQPSLDRAVLGGVMGALKLEPPLFPPQALGRVLEAISVALTFRAASPDVQDDLEGVLLAVGPHTVSGPAGLFRELLHRQAKSRHFWRQPELLRAFLAIALGARRASELAGQLDSLEAEAFSLAKQMGEHGGKRVLAAIERHAEAWPTEARAQWHFLARAVRPRGMRELARDGGFFLAGAIVTLGAALGMRWLGLM